jgi:GNAT superfamily N-acetyltransferase
MIELDSARWRELHPFFKRNNYRGFPCKGAKVFVSLDPFGAFIACAVLERKAGVMLLTGVLVEHSLRGQGVGRALILNVLRHWRVENDHPLYCFADPLLNGFYSQCGFASDLGTPELRQLKARYEGAGAAFVIFKSQ